MARVTGLGGVFLKANDKAALTAWYKQHLGMDVQDWGGAQFFWKDDQGPREQAYSMWTLFKADSTYFAPSEKPFMLNFRVDDLLALVAQLRAAGCAVDEKVDESEYGKFGWVTDPEGTKIELWEPPKA
jgi:catechol 2,3-dioxygenase-like lactoylglutathione lyase family enzyme